MFLFAVFSSAMLSGAVVSLSLFFPKSVSGRIYYPKFSKFSYKLSSSLSLDFSNPPPALYSLLSKYFT
jgi:hypothetical protein